MGPVADRAKCDRPSRRSSRHRASATGGWHPPCRSRGCGALPHVRDISPSRSSWRILPGASSRQSSSTLPWYSASTVRVWRAKAGLNIRVCMAAISESRPNRVANQGIPADRILPIPKGLPQQVNVLLRPLNNLVQRPIIGANARSPLLATAALPWFRRPPPGSGSPAAPTKEAGLYLKGAAGDSPKSQ
jgi:hypothetical protein